MRRHRAGEGTKHKESPASVRGDRYTICFIGNSHLIALQQALTAWPPILANGAAIKLFLAPTPWLDFLDYANGAIVGRNPQLRARLKSFSDETQIDIGRYDAFVLVGLRFLVRILGLCERIGTIEHRQWGDVDQLVSRTVFAETISAAFANADAIRIADMIRKRSKAPVLLCPVPYRAEQSLDDPQYKSLRRLHDAAYLESVLQDFHRAAEPIAAERGCEILWQPPETVALPGFTKFEYSRTAAAPDDPKAATDRWHGNAEFGRLYMAAILKRLDGLSGGRVLAREEAA